VAEWLVQMADMQEVEVQILPDLVLQNLRTSLFFQASDYEHAHAKYICKMSIVKLIISYSCNCLLIVS
jgi:hypothetical protein